MPKIDVTSIPGYEEMTIEEKLAAVLGVDVAPTSPDAEKLKAALSKANGEAAEYKRQLRARQSEQEAQAAEKEAEQAKMLEELKILRQERAIAQHKSKFLGVGYSEKLAEASAKAMIDGDTETVFRNLSDFIAEHDRSVRADSMRGMSKPVTGTSSSVTAEQFHKMSYADRVALYETDPATYSKLIGEK